MLRPIVETLAAFSSETFSCVSSPIQYAAVHAYSGNIRVRDYVRHCAWIHKIVSNYIYGKLQACQIECSRPEGSFYLFISFDKYQKKINKKLGIKSSEQLAHYLLENYSIAFLPGSDFYLAEDIFSFRLATVDYDGKEALEKIELGNELSDLDFNRIFPRLAQGVTQLSLFLSFLNSK